MISGAVNEHNPADLQHQLYPAHILRLLDRFRGFMAWQDPPLIDIEELHSTACAHLEPLRDLVASGVAVVVTKTDMPVDSIALLLAALALGCVATGELRHGYLYFGLSTEMAKHFMERPTLDLCLTYYLQHIFAMRSGTSNYAQGIMALAIQAAHGLGLDKNSHGTRGLLLFLLIYMADQLSPLMHRRHAFSLTRHTDTVHSHTVRSL